MLQITFETHPTKLPETGWQFPNAGRSDDLWWLEPYPDALMDDVAGGPEARYDKRESIALSFVADLQVGQPRPLFTLMLVQEPKEPGRKGGDDGAPPALVTISNQAAPARRERIYVGLDIGYREHVAAASPLGVFNVGRNQDGWKRVNRFTSPAMRTDSVGFSGILTDTRNLLATF